MKIIVKVLLTPIILCAQSEPDRADWENPRVFERNQVAPHAVVIPYTSQQAAIRNNRLECPYYLSLNGAWKFLWVEKIPDVPKGFFRKGFDTNTWYDIQVPCNWQMRGYGHPKFRNIHLSFPGYPPEVPRDYNPVGCYKRTFTIPDAWKDRKIFLRFEGVKSASLVWINGREVGYNEGGFEPAEYDITSFLLPGPNDIAVEVIRYSDGSYIENQDMWRLSGIYRDVWLYAAPRVHIRDFYIVTDLDASYQDATLTTKIGLQNLSVEHADLSVRLELFDPNMKSVFGSLTSEPIRISSQSSQEMSLSHDIENPAKWSSEKPNLYTLTMELIDGDSVLQAHSVRVGFHEVQIIDGAICVNGVAIKFNGVNSHMHHPEHGQAVPVETVRKDLELMKRFNINLVRTSHYPPSPEYLHLADEYGVYVVDETDDECHANIDLSENPEWRDVFVDRARKMVMRDRNHPSIIFWSAGNEAGWGENIKAVIEEGKRLDPSRPAWMYGGNRFYIPFEDITGPRYWIPLELKKLADNKVLDKSDSRPSFMDEYLAATGNSIGGLDEYWHLIRKYRRLSGGAIWDWVSPGIRVPFRTVPDASNNGNEGVLFGPLRMAKGQSGTAVDLSGHDEWVEFYRDTSLDLAGNSLTIEFRVYPRRLDRHQNAFLTKGNYQYGIVQNHADSLEFFVGTDKRNSVIARIPDNWYDNWHHVAGVMRRDSIELFVDFQSLSSVSIKGEIRRTPYPLCIGRNVELHNQGEFSGRLSNAIIDDLRIYQRALTIDEIQSQTADEAASKSVLSVSFDQVAEKGTFFSTGLGGRKYGIVWPDRKIQPEIWQIKKSAQPVKTEAVDLLAGKVKILNHHHFTNLNELESRWQLKANSTVLQGGALQLDVNPGGDSLVVIPFKQPLAQPGVEFWLEIIFSLLSDTKWAAKGHIVAWDQFRLPVSAPPTRPPGKARPKLTVEVTDSAIILSGDAFNYIFDKRAATFTLLKYAGQALVRRGPVLNVWRAPLSNDTDPWGSRYFASRNITPGLGYGIHNEWLSIGIDQLTHEVDSLAVRAISETQVDIYAKVFSFTSNGNSAFENVFRYSVFGDGEIVLHHRVIPHGPMPSYLPKIGLVLEIPNEMRNLKWYGRGPFETYPDRKTAARIDVYESTVDTDYVPYLTPQDYGNKTDVRWLAISDDRKVGLVIQGKQPINFSAHAFTTENLTRAEYRFQLQKADHISLNVDYRVSGVGDTARRVLGKYRVFPRIFENTLSIRPFHGEAAQ